MTRKEEEVAGIFGGSDKDDWSNYVIKDQRDGSLQPAHLSRSIRHQPNHLKCAVIKNMIHNKNFND